MFLGIFPYSVWMLHIRFTSQCLYGKKSRMLGHACVYHVLHDGHDSLSPWEHLYPTRWSRGDSPPSYLWWRFYEKLHGRPPEDPLILVCFPFFAPKLTRKPLIPDLRESQTLKKCFRSGVILLPGDIGHCVKTVWVVTAGGREGRCWHLGMLKFPG